MVWSSIIQEIWHLLYFRYPLWVRFRSKKSSLETLWDDRSDYQRLTLTDQINQPHDKVEECHQRSRLVHQTLPEASQEKSDTTFSVAENLLVPFFAFSVNDDILSSSFILKPMLQQHLRQILFVVLEQSLLSLLVWLRRHLLELDLKHGFQHLAEQR